jgi:hypothetical protein
MTKKENKVNSKQKIVILYEDETYITPYVIIIYVCDTVVAQYKYNFVFCSGCLKKRNKKKIFINKINLINTYYFLYVIFYLYTFEHINNDFSVFKILRKTTVKL